MKHFALLLVLVFGVQIASASVYRHNDGAFQLEFDDSQWEVSTKKWKSKKQPDLVPHQTLVTLQRKKADENYHTRLSVVREDAAKFLVKGEDPLTAYHHHTLEFLKSQRFGNLQVTKGKKILPKLGKNVYQTEANQRDFGLTFRQVVFLHKNHAYLITAASRTKEYRKQKKEIDQILNSFKLQAE